MSTEETKNDVEVYDGPMATYKMIKPTPYYDQDGNVTGEYEEGALHALPAPVGDKLVDDGFAEKVTEDSTEEVAADSAESTETADNGSETVASA